MPSGARIGGVWWEEKVSWNTVSVVPLCYRHVTGVSGRQRTGLALQTRALTLCGMEAVYTELLTNMLPWAPVPNSALTRHT